MMTQYDNNNSGALFKNDKKTKESQPDYRGTAEVNGQKYLVSSWIKTSKAGNKFMSLSFTVDNGEGQKAKPAPAVVEIDDSIPF
jgi:uncharacterized protein (DUF736 family)